MADMAIRYTVGGVTRRTFIPRDGHGKWKSDVNLHPAHAGSEAADLFAEALGLGGEGCRVNEWLARFLPSQTTVKVGNGKATGNGRREPVCDLPGVSLKIRKRYAASGGKRSSKLTTQRPASAGPLADRDLPALFAGGGDIPVVTVCLPQTDDGAYILAEEEVWFNISYPYREIAMRGFRGTVANARGKVGRAPKGTVLPTVWASLSETTCRDDDGTVGSWLFYGAHPHTDEGHRGEWSIGTLTEVRAIVAGLIDRR